MNPEGSNYQDIGDFQSAYSDYCVAPESAEFANTPFRKSTAVIDEKHGAGSNSAIHEILKCPACVNLMYSPTYEKEVLSPILLIRIFTGFAEEKKSNLHVRELLDYGERSKLPFVINVFSGIPIFGNHCTVLGSNAMGNAMRRAQMRWASQRVDIALSCCSEIQTHPNPRPKNPKLPRDNPFTLLNMIQLKNLRLEVGKNDLEIIKV
ncbi:hypothetical protein FXO37_10722 [Capsicum annuum]|nr:hypothetical protein FXO37_10722 [Capsicum annuum]